MASLYESSYISQLRPSSNNNSTKKSESSDDKPLNLSSKSVFPPHPPSPTKKADDIDLTVSSDGSKNEDGKTKEEGVQLKEEKFEAKAVSSRQASSEGKVHHGFYLSSILFIKGFYRLNSSLLMH